MRRPPRALAGRIERSFSMLRLVLPDALLPAALQLTPDPRLTLEAAIGNLPK
jgi:hypothetical protein